MNFLSFLPFQFILLFFLFLSNVLAPVCIPQKCFSTSEPPFFPFCFFLARCPIPLEPFSPFPRPFHLVRVHDRFPPFFFSVMPWGFLFTSGFFFFLTVGISAFRGILLSPFPSAAWPAHGFPVSPPRAGPPVLCIRSPHQR